MSARAETLTKGDLTSSYRPDSGRADLSFDRRDSARATPKAVVTGRAADHGQTRRPAVPLSRKGR